MHRIYLDSLDTPLPEPSVRHTTEAGGPAPAEPPASAADAPTDQSEASPAHTSPAHTGPLHTSPAHTSPAHTGPLHTSPAHTAGPPGGTRRLVIVGPEAHHAARAKRLRPGEPIELFDGRGLVARARVVEVGGTGTGTGTGTGSGGGRRGGDRLKIELEPEPGGLRRVPPPRPRVEVWSAVPKGGRAEDMLDQLSQAGADVWRPLRCARQVAEPTPKKIDRLHRVVVESAKQCGRAWLMEIGSEAALDELDRLAADPIGGPAAIWLADAGGVSAAAAMTTPAGEEPADDVAGGVISGGASDTADGGTSGGAPGTARGPSGTAGPARVVVLVGPEGGFTEAERAAAIDHGAVPVSLGPHIMRIETAAPVAAAVVRAVGAVHADAHEP